MDANVIKSLKLATERKQFYLDLKENERGLYLKITEDVHGRRDTILVPVEILEDLREALSEIIESCGENQPAAEPSY
jgi:hypothetical protein